MVGRSTPPAPPRSSRSVPSERCTLSTAEDAFDRVMRVDIFVDATNGGPGEKKQHMVTVSVVIAILEVAHADQLRRYTVTFSGHRNYRVLRLAVEQRRDTGQQFPDFAARFLAAAWN